MSNRVIPKEALRGLRRVDLGDLTGASPAAAESLPADRQAHALEQARAEGYRRGLEEGKRDAQARPDSERSALKELLVSLSRLTRDLEQGLASDVLSLSVELAKLIVRETISARPEVVLPVLREAIASLPSVDEQTVVRLHPADARLLHSAAEGDAALATLPWKIIEDAHIERGGCVLETATTEVDATLETRWRRVVAALGREDLWGERPG